MRNLTRLAFALSLAACGDPVTLQCENAVDQLACRCELDPSLPECDEPPVECVTGNDCLAFDDGACLVGVCNADKQCEARNTCEGDDTVASGEFVAFPQENGNTFFGFVTDFNAAFDELVDLEEAEDAAIPIDGCIEQTFTDIDGEPDRRSVGDVTVSQGGAPVATLMFDAETGRYEGIFTGIGLGEELDVAFPGEGALGQHNFIGFAAMPAAFPAFKNVVDNQIDLTNGIVTYDPLNGTYVHISTSFVDPQTQMGVSVICGTDGEGTLTIPPAFLARMPATGSLNLSITNRRFRALDSTDGVVRVIRSVVRMNKNVGYTKP